MCGIVGAIAARPVAEILIEGLKRLEYRGYDSAGIAIVDPESGLRLLRTLGKVHRLAEELVATPLSGLLGIAHTRWATHGVPATHNAHPHVSHDRCAIVHNGIVENHEALRREQLAAGHSFDSDTDTEVAAHAIYDELVDGHDLPEAVRRAANRLRGAYAFGVIDATDPERLVAARQGSPLVVGVGLGEHFIASDVFALLPVTNRFIFLEDGDIAELSRTGIRIWDRDGQPVERHIRSSALSAGAGERGPYRHYMSKEIFEQPRAIADTLNGRLAGNRVLPEIFGRKAPPVFAEIRAVTIVACGTSFHAGLVARYWLEAIAGLPCQVEVASEHRYRAYVVPKHTLLVTISQSGETADTLAALRLAKGAGYAATLAICNVAESSLVRESDLVFLTCAGPEIGVASTKAFSTQLTALFLLAITLGKFAHLTRDHESQLVERLRGVPARIEATLMLNETIERLAEQFIDKSHALFLGRGTQYPIAMEGALKLKEVSYIHAEAYPAGELKHGPLALIDERMPVVTVAPNNGLLEKLKSNLAEVRARGGQLYVFADSKVAFEDDDGLSVVRLPETDDLIDPFIFTVPLQLLAYHVAVLKGTDVDQPRNLAKSVTVE